MYVGISGDKRELCSQYPCTKDDRATDFPNGRSALSEPCASAAQQGECASVRTPAFERTPAATLPALFEIAVLVVVDAHAS